MSVVVSARLVPLVRWATAILVLATASGCGQTATNSPAAATAQLCETNFEVCVMPVFMSVIKRSGTDISACTDGTLGQCSCMGSSCHVGGGNGGRFTLSFTDMVTNRNSIILMFADFNNVANSTILTRPLAGTGEAHGGLDIFRDTSDPCYVAIHTWLSQQVQDQSDARCASCAQIANITAACGYVP